VVVRSILTIIRPLPPILFFKNWPRLFKLPLINLCASSRNLRFLPLHFYSPESLRALNMLALPRLKEVLSISFIFPALLNPSAGLFTASSNPPTGPRAGKVKKQKNSVRKIVLKFYYTFFLALNRFPGQELSSLQGENR
jgi:hypothetical protein